MSEDAGAVVESWIGNKHRRATVAVKTGKGRGAGYKIINATDFDPNLHEKYEAPLPYHDINETAADAALKVDEKGRVEVAALRAKSDAALALVDAEASEARALAMRKQADAQVIQAEDANKLAQVAIAEHDALLSGATPAPAPPRPRGRPKA
jgi:hypothetical protein